MVTKLENRIDDMLDWVQRKGLPRASDFLDPREQEEVAVMLQKETEAGYLFSGGYEGAERRILVLYPTGGEKSAAGMAGEALTALAVEPLNRHRSNTSPVMVGQSPGINRGKALPVSQWKLKPPDELFLNESEGREPDSIVGKTARITGTISEDNRTPGPSHRDYLGAILGQGIRREKIGDIIVEAERAVILLKSEIIKYLNNTVSQVGRWEVSTAILPLSEVEPPARRFKEIRGTVASLRLDALASLAFGTSRSKILPFIKGERVEVNWQVVTQPARQLTAGDTISIRGKGRALLEEVPGQSKKGRLVVLIKKYI